MTADPPAEPSLCALGESLAALAAQLADLRGEISAINARLDRAGLGGDLNLAARFKDLAQTVLTLPFLASEWSRSSVEVVSLVPLLRLASSGYESKNR